LSLALNLARLGQIWRVRLRLRPGRGRVPDLDALLATLRPERHPRGDVLFRKGHIGDAAYYVVQGEVAFPERGARAGPGEIFGEIGVFSPDRVRTASAVCATDVELYRIDSGAIVVAFHQDPEFAFALVRLITQRMVENIGQLETDVARLRSAAQVSPAAAGAGASARRPAPAVPARP
jgi:CRP/FNR family transcriptional regulator, cyclic AMP receptor protein